MIDPQVIAKRLREARETTKDESTALTEQLAIIDAVIDEYDEVINKLDNLFSFPFKLKKIFS